MHYVTYGRVYDATADEVTVGFTPGYNGTVVNDGLVIYSTGVRLQILGWERLVWSASDV
jgi:hypothetical protein